MSKSGCGGSVQAQAKAHRSNAPASRLSAPRRNVNARTITPQKIKSHLTASHIETLCRHWLPQGSKQGNWWVCCTPWREDTKPSLGVSFTTGRWKDFATGEHGDMIDLSMKLFGDSLRDTLDGFAEMLGLGHA